MWKLLKVRLRTLLTKKFLLLIRVPKRMREANAHVYHLVQIYTITLNYILAYT